MASLRPSFKLKTTGDMKKNWEKFEEAFNSYATLMGYRTLGKEKPQSELKALMYALPEDTTFLLHNTITWAAYEDKTDPKLILEKLRKCYVGTKNMIRERVKFNTMFRSQSEPIDHWEDRCRKQGEKCEYCVSCVSQLIRDRFIAGINNDRLITELVNSTNGTDVTLDSVILKAKEYENTLKQNISSADIKLESEDNNANSQNSNYQSSNTRMYPPHENIKNESVSMNKDISVDIELKGGNVSMLSHDDNISGIDDEDSTDDAMEDFNETDAHRDRKIISEGDESSSDNTSSKPKRRRRRQKFSAKTYKCDTCGRNFTKNSHLTAHVRIHTGEKPFTCDICGKGFGRSCHLSSHMKTHTGEKPFKCQICGKCFNQDSNLSVHMRMHTGERPYQCAVCGKCFAHTGHAAIHARTHTGEKPYKCDICDKTFADSSTRRSHQVIHTGEKPFKCEICGKRFGFSSTRNTHRKIHLTQTIHKCDVCGKCFDNMNDLSAHVATHTDDVSLCG